MHDSRRAVRSLARLVRRRFRSNTAGRRIEGFRAAIGSWTLGGFRFSKVSSPPISVNRTKIPVTPQPRGSLVHQRQQAHDQLSRSCETAAGGTAGVPFVLSLGEEMHIGAGAGPRVQLYLTRDSFQAIAPLLDAARGMALNTSRGQPARRLHAAAGAESSSSADRGRIAACPGNPGDGGRLPRAVRRPIGGSRQPYRSHADGEGAAAVRGTCARRRSARTSSAARQPRRARSFIACSKAKAAWRITSSAGGSRRASRCCAIPRTTSRSARSPSALLRRRVELQPGVSAGVRHESERRAGQRFGGRPWRRGDMKVAGSETHSFGECLRSL